MNKCRITHDECTALRKGVSHDLGLRATLAWLEESLTTAIPGLKGRVWAYTLYWQGERYLRTQAGSCKVRLDWCEAQSHQGCPRLSLRTKDGLLELEALRMADPGGKDRWVVISGQGETVELEKLCQEVGHKLNGAKWYVEQRPKQQKMEEAVT